MLKRWCHRDDM